jgi:hypothetical protein
MLLFWSTIWASAWHSITIILYDPELTRLFLLGKFSLLVFFRQLLVGLPRYMVVWWAAVILVLLSYLGCMLSNFLTCVPLTKYWSASMLPKPADFLTQY